MRWATGILEIHFPMSELRSGLQTVLDGINGCWIATSRNSDTQPSSAIYTSQKRNELFAIQNPQPLAYSQLFLQETVHTIPQPSS